MNEPMETSELDVEQQMQAGAPAAASMHGWFLPLEAVNSIQVDTILRTVSRAKHAHHTDIDIRINGQNERYEADWIKHLRRVDGAPAAQAPRWHFERMQPSGTILAVEPTGERHVIKGGDMDNIAGRKLLDAMATALSAAGVATCPGPARGCAAICEQHPACAARGVPVPAQTVPQGHKAVPLKKLAKLAALIDPAPVEVDGKVMVFQNPMAAEVLRRLSAEIRELLEYRASDADGASR